VTTFFIRACLIIIRPHFRLSSIFFLLSLVSCALIQESFLNYECAVSSVFISSFLLLGMTIFRISASPWRFFCRRLYSIPSFRPCRHSAPRPTPLRTRFSCLGGESDVFRRFHPNFPVRFARSFPSLYRTRRPLFSSFARRASVES